jgi:hypothetical protein
VNPVTPSARAAARLLDDKGALARAITDAMYEERPGLAERYGARGRARCLEDLHFTLEHLIPAVDLGEPALFVSYARWLDGLLRSRSVDADDVRFSLATTARLVGERLPADEAQAVVAVVQAGLAALGGDGR